MEWTSRAQRGREPRVLGHRGARDVHVGRIHDHRVVGHQAMIRNHPFPSQVIENRARVLATSTGASWAKPIST
jgi:hypothetical protein